MTATETPVQQLAQLAQRAGVAMPEKHSWCCANGCGDCRPVLIDFEYSRTEDIDGNLIESKTEKVWASHCCSDDLELWDEDKMVFIDLPPNWSLPVGSRV